jgi:hypothetical protein
VAKRSTGKSCGSSPASTARERQQNDTSRRAAPSDAASHSGSDRRIGRPRARRISWRTKPATSRSDRGPETGPGSPREQG